MPSYEYRCEKCETVQEIIHSIKKDPVIKCPECDSVCKRLISNNYAGFIFKGGTSKIHGREKELRKKRSKELDVKQRERYGGMMGDIQPNIAGVKTDSWSDAQRLAKEAGMNTESYTPWVGKEQQNKKKKAKKKKVKIT